MHCKIKIQYIKIISWYFDVIRVGFVNNVNNIGKSINSLFFTSFFLQARSFIRQTVCMFRMLARRSLFKDIETHRPRVRSFGVSVRFYWSYSTETTIHSFIRRQAGKKANAFDIIYSLGLMKK